MLSPSTRTRSSASTSMTAPRRPLSRPALTITVSPLRIFFMAVSQYLGRERNNLHELHVAELARHGPEYSRADRFQLVGEQHRRVGIEADQRSVRAAHPAARTHHHGVVHLALLDLAARNGVLHAHLDDDAHGGVATLRAAQNFDAHQPFGAAVVGHIEHGSKLDHWR